MVRPRGFEPLAYSFGDCRSIQLSYGRTFEKVIMTPVRFSMAVLAAIVLFAATAPPQKAGILRREYQARRDALSKSIGADALFIARRVRPSDVRATSTGRSARKTTSSTSPPERT